MFLALCRTPFEARGTTETAHRIKMTCGLVFDMLLRQAAPLMSLHKPLERCIRASCHHASSRDY